MADKTKKKRGSIELSQNAMWALVAVALVAGLLIGRFALVGIGSGSAAGSAGRAAGATSLAGVTAITEDQLDLPMGSYTYNGREYDITIREVIQMASTLEAAQNEDGTYQLPSADNLITYARNQVILKAAEAQGITVSDEEVASYALEQLGSDDFAILASQYGLDEEMVRSMVADSALTTKFREEAAGLSIPTAPIAPPEPAEDAVETPTEEYAQYIIGLAGDAWDAEAGTWADPDGEWAATLGNYEITSSSATYEAAQAAYYLAYQTYSVEAQAASQLWTSFYNDLFSNGSVTINTLVS